MSSLSALGLSPLSLNAVAADQAGQTIGWTGFTWDPHLFPNPNQFLSWCKQRGLRNTLNLHPASGMQPWEDKYVVCGSGERDAGE
jgi:alpha-glucosidase (family GH31 glycosyl hydrolase)